MSDKRPCVLLVEDDIDCAEELAELLDSYGMSVTVAHNLAQARDTAARQTFDVLLVDVGLGHERGLDLAQTWHCEGRFVVLLTGSAVPEADMRSFSDLAPAVMIKPVDVPQLLDFAMGAGLAPNLRPAREHFCGSLPFC